MEELIESMMGFALRFNRKIATPTEIRCIYLAAFITSRRFDGRLNCWVYHDTLLSSIKSTRGNKCSQVYATDFCWSRNFPIKSKSQSHHTLDEFFHRYGVPASLISDNAKELTQGEFARNVRQAQCPIDVTDTYSPWQNRAESEIGELKRLSGRWMVKKKSPKVLWAVDGPSYVYGDNMSVLHNTSNPESTLKKKSNSIA
jgi:hypothetical protein